MRIHTRHTIYTLTDAGDGMTPAAYARQLTATTKTAKVTAEL